MTITHSVLAVLVVSACTTGDDPPRCTDPKYGDGVCDLETSCAAPDIDCYAIFATQDEAQQWYADNAVPGRPPAPASDARFAKMHDLLLEGWAAYQATHDVGDLAQHEPQLVLIDSTDPNAFALRDKTDHAGLAVMVHTGLIDLGAPDDEVLGVVMHEITHALQLHVFDEIRERTRQFYLAPPTTEPLGLEQVDDPVVRDHAEQWLALATEGGYLVDAELGGLPTTGRLSKLFVEVVTQQAAANPTACAASKTQFDALGVALGKAIDPVSGSVAIDQSDAMTILAVFTKLQNECFANFTPDAITVVAAAFGLDETQLRASLPPELRMLVEGHNFVGGMYNWLLERRREMRDVEARFAAATGSTWDRVRYFTTEEAADDSSVLVLNAVGLEADGIGKFLPKIQPGLEPICRPLVDADAAIPTTRTSPMNITACAGARGTHVAMRGASAPPSA